MIRFIGKQTYILSDGTHYEWVGRQSRLIESRHEEELFKAGTIEKMPSGEYRYKSGIEIFLKAGGAVSIPLSGEIDKTLDQIDFLHPSESSQSFEVI